MKKKTYIYTSRDASRRKDHCKRVVLLIQSVNLFLEKIVRCKKVQSNTIKTLTSLIASIIPGFVPVLD